MYLYWIYSVNNCEVLLMFNWGVHLYWIYSANNCAVLFSWGVSVCPSGTRLGHVHILRFIFVLDILPNVPQTQMAI